MIFSKKKKKKITYKKTIFLKNQLLLLQLKNYYDIKKLLYHYNKTEYKSSVNRIVETLTTKTKRNYTILFPVPPIFSPFDCPPFWTPFT